MYRTVPFFLNEKHHITEQTTFNTNYFVTKMLPFVAVSLLEIVTMTTPQLVRAVPG